MIAGLWPTQDRGLSAGGVRSAVAWQERNPWLVHTHEGPAFDVRLFLRRCQPWRRHGSSTASSRWVARSIGNCGVPCRRFSNRETWAVWYQLPHSSPITVATRAQVQHSPRKPFASAPWAKSSGITHHWIGPVGLGLARQAAMPCSRLLASHWLTAAGDIPRAAAISYCFHPCCPSSNARWRRVPRQISGDLRRRSMCGG
jgi:hypothetical protein